MSFISLLSNEKLIKKNAYYSRNKVIKFNPEKTKIVIAGTITPKYHKDFNPPFYYSGKYNYLFNKLDYCLNLDGKLKQLKKDSNYCELKNALEEKGIALIDVVESCTFKGDTFVRDDELTSLCLDYGAFNGFKDKKFIVTSKNALEALKIIFDKNHIDFEEGDNVFLRPQNRKGSSLKEWKDTYKECLEGIKDEK